MIVMDLWLNFVMASPGINWKVPRPETSVEGRLDSATIMKSMNFTLMPSSSLTPSNVTVYT